MSDDLSAVGLEGSLVEKAILADEVSETVTPLRELWEAVISGEALIITSFYTSTRCFLIVSPTPIELQQGKAGPTRLPWRTVEILKRVLLGVPQKIIAMDLNLSTSSVNTVATQALRAIGLRCAPTRVPVMLVMAAYTAHDKSNWPQVRRSTVMMAQGSYGVVSVPRPDPSRALVLSGAEQKVVSLLVERRSNAEIARLRSTSPRTVANQLARVIQKLHVGGRCGIVNWLVCGFLEYRPLPGPFSGRPTGHAIETDPTQVGNVATHV